MSVSRDEEAFEAAFVDPAFIAFQELKEEAASLEQQRRNLNDQRALLDLERAELEQQLPDSINKKRCWFLRLRSFA